MTEEMKQEFVPNFFGERSPEIDQLVVALAKAHSDGLGNVSKDAKNPHFGNQYATLAACVDAIMPALTKNGLVVMQLVTGPGRVKTVLAHTSGQYVSSELELPPVKGDPQAAGSAVTYSRRYSLPAIVGVATDSDDDGNAASGRKNGAEKSPADAFVAATSAPKGETVPDAKTRAFMTKMFEVGQALEKVLTDSGHQSPRLEVKERMIRVLGNEGFEKLEDVLDSAARRRVYGAWQDTLEAAQKIAATAA